MPYFLLINDKSVCVSDGNNIYMLRLQMMLEELEIIICMRKWKESGRQLEQSKRPLVMDYCEESEMQQRLAIDNQDNVRYK